ncbi:ATP synthase subunit C, partial [Streptomyces galbus]|nr:hypothetical protein [Streptomyces galbus]
MTAVALTALGIGYAIGRTGPATDNAAAENAVPAGSTPHPEITRTSGLSRVKAEEDGGAVRIRPCPGPAPYGSHDCPESSITYVHDGTSVQMWCWTDSTAPDGYPANNKRWFYVYQPIATPDTRPEGYVYSAFIPPSEQIRTPECSTQRFLELHPPSPAPPDPTPESSTTPVPEPSPVPTPPTKAPEPVSYTHP